ncbi:MAG: GNAT family N-acetyltransferase [Flavobacteriaceae bacterium]
MNPDVIHEKENDRFIIYSEGKESFIEYRINDDEINLYHTYTDPGLRGKGLAALVVRAAFEYAKENNLKVLPTCSYVQAFIKRNDEYSALIAE